MARKNAALEAHGIPTVGIVYKNFAGDFKSSARAVGVLELRAVVVDSAYTGLAPDAVRADVTKHIDEIVRALTTPLRSVQPGTLSEKIATQAGYEAPWGIVDQGPVDQQTIRFAGPNYDDVYEKFQQKFLDWGWGDGFPLIPPTRERVSEMLKGTSHAPDRVLTNKFYPAHGIATIELVAIQAVMAGAQPSAFPVILAAVQCMINAGEMFILTAQTTSPTTPFFWINGPIIKKLGINFSTGTLGPGAQSRVNIAIGRAARLVMMNIGGAYLGVKDMDTIGAPDKFSLVTAENEEDCVALGWQPYHVGKGFAQTDSTITMVPTTDHGHVVGMSTDSAEALLEAFAEDMGHVAVAEWTSGIGSAGVVLLSGDDSRLLVNGGFKRKEEVSEFIAKRIHFPRETFIKYFRSQAIGNGQLEQMLAKYPAGRDIYGARPERIIILRVGAFEGKNDFYRGGGAQTVKISDWQ